MREHLFRLGNVKAIMDMHDAGMGVNQIAGVFADNGIPRMTAREVGGVVASYGVLGEKVLPRSATNAAIKAHRAAGLPLAA